jgi:alpha-amylase/alpha-mannosidase (GH57 family)
MSEPRKYICIHGHFYQPPRENAWLESVEMQDSAAPFHDWNERINYECYAPNAMARILGEKRKIVDIVNNYVNISFNFGPTLLSWMEKADPKTYERILEADQISRQKYDGHGSALAQAHSHLILPLCNERDKETQVIWGIRDFESRFGRKPEGMWLAETAANTESLEVLAEQGIKFTVLAPRQGKAIRKLGSKEWIPQGHAEIDSRRPYLCKLPSGREIVLFFYHGGIAQGVAFEGLLNNGIHFAERFLQSFDQEKSPQLVHIATDGESYGHHHRSGEMALAACLRHIEEHEHAQVVNYGQYLEMFPPTYEVQIHENSSWSCVHGVERWRSNCGCSTGGRPHWTQEWRKPLREALDWLRDELIPIYEREATAFLKDIWAARNDYIDVLLDRQPATIDQFLEKHCSRPLDEQEKTKLLRLMEMQRHAMLMYTSCGWFFDEISGLETNQILQYANRAIHYAWQVSKADLHKSFVDRLQKAPSNVYENGASSYLKYVVPAQVDLEGVGRHYAASSIFEEYPEHLEFFNYIAESESFYRLSAGLQRLAVGRTTVMSKTTHSKKRFSFAVLYLGQQHIIGNISLDMLRDDFDVMADRLRKAFSATNLGEVIGIMQEYFGKEKFSIWQLFLDEKQKILQQITERSKKQVENAFRDIYNDNYQLMVGIEQSDIPVPEFFLTAAQFVINRDLRKMFENGSLNIRKLNHLYREFRRWNLKLTDEQSFKLAASNRLFSEIQNLQKTEAETQHLATLNTILTVLSQLDIKLDFWKSQNAYYSLLREKENNAWEYPSEAWKEAFIQLGELLSIRGELVPAE